MKRTLALLCFLPIILGNSRCDPVYAILGFESAIDTAQEATTQTEIVGMGEEPTPFIAQSPTQQAGRISVGAVGMDAGDGPLLEIHSIVRATTAMSSFLHTV